MSSLISALIVAGVCWFTDCTAYQCWLMFFVVFYGERACGLLSPDA